MGILTTIRPAMSEEYPAICAAMAAIDPWVTLGMTAENLLAAISQDTLRQLWVCEIDGTIAGGIGFRVRGGNELILNRKGAELLARTHGYPDGELPKPSDIPDGGYVNSLAVFPGFQGQKIGEKLLSLAEEHTSGSCDRIFLCVSDFNPGARRFYERHGYEFLGEIRDMIVPGKHEHLMRKILT